MHVVTNIEQVHDVVDGSQHKNPVQFIIEVVRASPLPPLKAPSWFADKFEMACFLSRSFFAH